MCHSTRDVAQTCSRAWSVPSPFTRAVVEIHKSRQTSTPSRELCDLVMIRAVRKSKIKDSQCFEQSNVFLFFAFALSNIVGRRERERRGGVTKDCTITSICSARLRWTTHCESCPSVQSSRRVCLCASAAPRTRVQHTSRRSGRRGLSRCGPRTRPTRGAG